MNKLTIQINNLEALERLIGGQSEVEIEIRNAVVQKFAEKHLKPIASSKEMSSVLYQIQESIKTEVSDKCSKEIATFQQSWNGSISDVKLRAEIKTEIDRQVRTLTDDMIRKSVEESIAFWANETELTKRINARFEYYTTNYINDEIRKRIEKMKASL